MNSQERADAEIHGGNAHSVVTCQFWSQNGQIETMKLSNFTLHPEFELT
jgi:hypothetical protein